MTVRSRTVQFGPRTRNLFLHVLTACNLHCRHCYVNPKEHGTGMLDKDTISRWLALFAGDVPAAGAAGCPKKQDRPGAAGETNVIFLGGEPTLNPDLPAGVREARRLGYGSVTVDTNGFLFHNILERVRPGEVDYFSFSLDGSRPEVNDPIRGSGVFDVCSGGIRKALGLGFGVSVIFTASRMNLHDLENMPPLLNRLGVKRFFVQVIGIRGKSAREGGDSLQLRCDEWRALVPGVARRAAESGIHVTYPKVFLDSDEEFQCAGRVADNFFVFPNGRVYRCPLCEDYPLHSLEIVEGRLRVRPPVKEADLFGLEIAEGCVLNKILHPGNIEYDAEGRPLKRIACCMLKEEVLPGSGAHPPPDR